MEVLDQNQPQETARHTEAPVSVGQWMLTMLIMIIPIVNIVMLFVWAFGDNTPVSKANWAKASLIWFAIGIIIGIFCWTAIMALFAGAYLAS